MTTMDVVKAGGRPMRPCLPPGLERRVTRIIECRERPDLLPREPILTEKERRDLEAVVPAYRAYLEPGARAEISALLTRLSSGGLTAATDSGTRFSSGPAGPTSYRVHRWYQCTWAGSGFVNRSSSSGLRIVRFHAIGRIDPTPINALTRAKEPGSRSSI